MQRIDRHPLRVSAVPRIPLSVSDAATYHRDSINTRRAKCDAIGSRLLITDFALLGKRGQIVTIGTGRHEVYQEDPKSPGLMLFLGYWDQLEETHPNLCACILRAFKAHIINGL